MRQWSFDWRQNSHLGWQFEISTQVVWLFLVPKGQTQLNDEESSNVSAHLRQRVSDSHSVQGKGHSEKNEGVDWIIKLK